MYPAAPWCRFYWRIHPQMVEPEQTLIKSTWPSLPNKVDAAYENSEKDLVIIFSGGCTAGIVWVWVYPPFSLTPELNSAMCFHRDPNVGFEWIQPGGRLSKVHTQTWTPQRDKENRCCRAHRRHRENSALYRRGILEVSGDDSIL